MTNVKLDTAEIERRARAMRAAYIRQAAAALVARVRAVRAAPAAKATHA